MDIVVGVGNHCVVTLVERVTGATMIGRLRCRKVADVNRRVIELIEAHPQLFITITVDNGPEFHGYKQIEAATGVKIYFANPYSSWERGTNENTNGLIRQYIPKRTSMKTLTQERCNAIASALNNRPRKRHGFRTPLERLAEHFHVA
jgi:IS30 family transposase